MKKENITDLPLIMVDCKMNIKWNTKISGIYAWINNVNNKMYIGQSKNLYKRVYYEMNHFVNGKSQNLIKLENAIKKYDIKNFKVVKLLECSVSCLNKAEKIFIEYYDTKKNGYNCTYGGEGTSGHILTKEQIEKHKKKLKSYWTEERKREHSDKMKVWFNSKTVSEQENMKTGYMWWLNKEYKEKHIKHCRKSLTSERIEKQKSSILKYYDKNINKKSVITKILSPDNITINIFGLTKFCKKYQLCYSGIKQVLNGDKKHHMGWHIDPNFVFIKLPTKKLISPNNIVYEFHSILKFCKEHNLNLSGIKNVLNKNSNHYKLWRLPNVSLIEAMTNNSPIYKNIQFKYDDGHIEQVVNKREFCKKYNFSVKYLYKFLKNKSIGDIFCGLKLVSK